MANDRDSHRIMSSGVAGPLAAWGGGQICRPFVLGFGNWRACLQYKSHVMSTVTSVYQLADLGQQYVGTMDLFLKANILHANKYEITI